MNFDTHILGVLFGITFKLEINLVRIYLFTIVLQTHLFVYSSVLLNKILCFYG